MKKLKLEELGRISVQEFKGAQKISVCLLLDNVRSLHNVGSAFRTADAFRIEKIILTGITGKPPHREIEKTALGATQSIAWEYHQNAAIIAQRLQNEGYRLIMVEQTTASIALQKFQPSSSEKYCLIFGNEVSGISEEVISLGNISLEIPQSGTKHSLNIAVCLGIVLWEFYKKLSL